MRVLYLTNLNLDLSTASALRIRGIAEALTAVGAQVSVLQTGRARPAARGRAGGLRSLVALLNDPSAKDPIAGERPDCVIVYGTPSGLLRSAIRASRKSGVTLALDIVEWYDSRHLPMGQLGPFALANEFSMRKLATQADKVIAISSFLQQYYADRGIPSLRVPPLFAEDIRRASPHLLYPDDRVHLCFAGSGGGKDTMSLRHLVAACARVDPMGKLLNIHIVGLEPDELHKVLEGIDIANIQMSVHGRITHETAVGIVSGCDFVVLQRPARARFAQAGFPSKVAESLVLGTAVMSNLTSDLEHYLVDGSNSLVLNGDTLDDMVEGVRRAMARKLTWSRGEIAANADTQFNPNVYSQSIYDFLAR